MNEPERYDDPALARRVRAWVKDAAPTTAPERLVYAVMDEVERERPRPRGMLGPIRLGTLMQYVALTVVIAIGVAAGTLATRQNPSGASPVPSGPTASPSGQRPSPVPAPPSLPTIGRYDISRDPGPSAIGINGSSLWVGTPDGSIVELDAATGGQVASVSVGFEPTTIAPAGGLLWVGSSGKDLTWVDPVSREVGTISGAGGIYVLPWSGSLLVSRREEFLEVDPSTRRIVGSFPIPGHVASEPGLVVGDELWAGAGARIVRVALPSGTVLGTMPVTASALVAAGDGILAIDAGVLLRVSTSSGPLDAPITILDGLPQPYGVAIAGDRLWVTGPAEGRGGEVVEVDLTAGVVASLTPVGRGTRAIAVVDRSVWVAVDTGALLRLSAGT